MNELKTLYVRIQQRQQATRFYRCGMEFGRNWKKVSDLDAATAQRLEEEQMLEVTAQRPADFEEDAPAGDSAAVDPKPPVAGQPPASAPAVSYERVIEVNATVIGMHDDLEKVGTSMLPATAPDKPTDPAELAAAIKAAVNGMDQDNAELWTAGGKPKAESIAAITGWPVSAAERDAALQGA